MTATRRYRLAAPVMFAGVLAALVLPAAVAAASVTAITGAGCKPGSGPNLAGKTITAAMLSAHSDGLQCANLTGADLSGLSFPDANFTGALLTNANLQGAQLGQSNFTGAILKGVKAANIDLTQATISDADFTGADLTDAQLIQATSHGTNFTNANLSHANAGQAEMQGANLTGANLTGTDFTQADMTGAKLDKANVSGTSFTQATLTNVSWQGATGTLPLSNYLLIAAVVIFALLVLRTIIRKATSGRAALAMTNYGTVRSSPSIIRGVIGALLVSVGCYAFFGGLVGTILGAEGPPESAVCTAGALCKIGAASGFVGIFAGIIVIIVGFGTRAGRTTAVSSSGPLINPGGFGPLQTPGGFNQPPGGFNQPQGGFGQPGGFGQQGGFNQPQGGFNQPQGGFNQPQGGFNQPGGFGGFGQQGSGPADSPPGGGTGWN